eukprot:SAG31_NODE_40241_length_282_cov_0.781421_1_plen_77_part_01
MHEASRSRICVPVRLYAEFEWRRAASAARRRRRARGSIPRSAVRARAIRDCRMASGDLCILNMLLNILNLVAKDRRR